MGLVVAWAGALWLPWIVSPRVALVPVEAARPGYLFYAAPLVPCIALALAYALREIRGRWRPAVTGAIVAVALFGATLLYPVWTGMPTSRAYLEDLVDR
jgi:dolichyl-phosphate-mannose--protein O-mannosyl transferase